MQVTGLKEVLGGVEAILSVLALGKIMSSGLNLPNKANYLSSGDLEKCSSTGVYTH